MRLQEVRRNKIYRNKCCSCESQHFFICCEILLQNVSAHNQVDSVLNKRCYVLHLNPYPTAFPYGNGMVLHFYQQQESSTTKTVHKVINKRLKAYV